MVAPKKSGKKGGPGAKDGSNDQFANFICDMLKFEQHDWRFSLLKLICGITKPDIEVEDDQLLRAQAHIALTSKVSVVVDKKDGNFADMVGGLLKSEKVDIEKVFGTANPEPVYIELDEAHDLIISQLKSANLLPECLA